MLERSDLISLHEPLEGLLYIGPVDVGSHTFESTESLVAWLLDGSTRPVFIKETVGPGVLESALSNDRLLSEVRHSFLIRRPEEIAASFFALEGDMRIHDSGVEALHQLFMAVSEAQGDPPVVVDSDDLVAHPEATMRAYCTAVGLPFEPDAMTWQTGLRPEWQRTARWHEDASASTGFVKPTHPDRHSLAAHPDVIRFAARHRPFYEELRAQRLRIDSHPSAAFPDARQRPNGIDGDPRESRVEQDEIYPDVVT